jgi:hypothetical protein
MSKPVDPGGPRSRSSAEILDRAEAPYERGMLMPNDSGISDGKTVGIASPSGFPFGSTSISDDTGCRYQGLEIRLSRDWRNPHTWRIVSTGQRGSLPHQYLLDKPEGEPLGFESRSEALAYALTEFQTVGTLALGTVFTREGRKYMTVKVPNWKSNESGSFIPVLDLESFTVIETHKDLRPETVGR